MSLQELLEANELYVGLRTFDGETKPIENDGWRRPEDVYNTDSYSVLKFLRKIPFKSVWAPAVDV